MSSNWIVAMAALLAFISFFIGYSLGRLQRDAAVRPMPEIDLDTHDPERRARQLQR